MRVAVAVCALADVMVATEWRSSLSVGRRNGSLLTRLADATASPPLKAESVPLVLVREGDTHT